MELVKALAVEPSRPLVQSVLLMLAAIHDSDAGDGKRWVCCCDDGSPAPSLSATTGWMTLVERNTVEPIVEMQYRAGKNSFLKIKWVPIDGIHVTMIAQCSVAGEVHRPTNVMFCTEEEPLASIMGVRGASGVWTAEITEAAVLRLRRTLRDILEKQMECENTSVTTHASPLKEETLKPHETTRHSFRAECFPGGDCGTASQAAQSLFSGMAPRQPGHRYGEGDLIPGGSLAPDSSSGMLLNSSYFRGDAARYARYDPMFPGDAPRGAGGMQLPGPNRLFPGEPNPDNLQPPGGPSFGPRFGPGGGGSGWSPFLQ